MDRRMDKVTPRAPTLFFGTPCSCKISLHFLDSGNELKLCKASLHFVYIFLFVRCLTDWVWLSLGLRGDNKVATQSTEESQSGERSPGLSCLAPGPESLLCSAHYLGLVLIEAGPGPHQTSGQSARLHTIIANMLSALCGCCILNGLIAFIWWELLPSWWCNMICQCWQVYRVKLLMCTIMINSRKCNLNSSLNFDIIQEDSSKI